MVDKASLQTAVESGRIRNRSHLARIVAQTIRSVLSDLSSPLAHEGSRDSVNSKGFEALLLQAVVATNADFGNIQLLVQDGLRIKTQFGFQQPFLSYFAYVQGAGSACGAAMHDARQTVVANVNSHPIFADGTVAQVMRDAEVQAVQSTPLLVDGKLLGMLSTHCRRPREFTSGELGAAKRIAELAARWAALHDASAERLRWWRTNALRVAQ